MGKVRTQVVKKVAKELLERYPDAFTTSFEENKRAVERLLEVDGKKLRNKIAGYITNLKRIEERRKVALAAAPA